MHIFRERQHQGMQEEVRVLTTILLTMRKTAQEASRFGPTKRYRVRTCTQPPSLSHALPGHLVRACSFSISFPLALALSLSLTLLLFRSFTLALSLSLAFFLFFSLSFSFSRLPSLSLTFSRTLSLASFLLLSFSLAHSLSRFLSLALAFSLAYLSRTRVLCPSLTPEIFTSHSSCFATNPCTQDTSDYLHVSNTCASQHLNVATHVHASIHSHMYLHHVCGDI